MRCQRNALSSMLAENSAAAVTIALVRTLAKAAPSPRRGKREITHASSTSPSHGKNLRQRGGGRIAFSACASGGGGCKSCISSACIPELPRGGHFARGHFLRGFGNLKSA